MTPRTMVTAALALCQVATGSAVGAVEVEAAPAQQAELAQLSAEVAALRSAEGEPWLTERRAEEIRGVVGDVLADSGARSAFRGDGAVAGYQDGFFLASSDGNYSVKVNALEQVRFVWNNSSNDIGNENTWGFENQRTQAFFSGNVVDPSWRYLVGLAFDAQTDPYVEASDSFQLYYANVTKDLGGGFSVAIGQMNVPWTVESQLFNAGFTQMGNYSIFEYQWGAGQQVGALLGFESSEFRARGGWFNIVNSSVTNPSWNDTDNQSFAVAGRAEWKLAGSWKQFAQESSFRGEEFGLLLGGGVTWQNARAENSGQFAGSSPVTLTVDAQAKFGGLNVVGQLAWAEDEVSNGGWPGSAASNWGSNIQIGGFVADPLELFGAWAYAQTLETTNFLQAGANWYVSGNAAKFTLMAVVPLDSSAANSENLRDFTGGVGLGPIDNNCSVIAQFQMMF